ncbi:ATP-binding cassette domain-containing protein [Jatrophihabitans sp.]|uniref:ABC transporter ATP-binding protein n=1 Tax=Jatrophihabitans sp. TaxID=1932789 RepID=UPI0030C6F7E3|nr:type transport system ATP-binding protein [Jatrophihabitans sp.]
MTGASDSSRIVVNGLSKDFGRGIKAVDQLSFTVEPGSVTGFLGPNGAGKTTTLRMLLGLVNPSAGTATIGGQAYRDITNPLTRVGASLEASSYHPARTGLNHLRILCAAAGLPDSRADAVIAQVGLGDAAKRKVRGYSLGMRQRLGLAAALIGDPGVLILDEPANGLDPDGIRWLRGFFRHLAAEGRSVLVSSHQLNEIQEVADRVVILDRGRLVRSGSIDELTAGTDVVRVHTPTPQPFAAALAAAGLGVVELAPGVLDIRGGPVELVGHLAFVNGIELHQLSGSRANLEDLFFALTQGAHQALPQRPPAPQPRVGGVQ